MSRVRKALATVRELLDRKQRRLAKARRRHRARRREAVRHHRDALGHELRADRLRAEGKVAAAARADKEADRAHTRAYRRSRRAQWWLGQVKLVVQQIDGLEAREAALQAELVKLRVVEIDGNRATGGTPGQRWKAVCIASVRNCAMGKRRNFYSMSGAWNIDHPITPGEQYGQRSDCSQTVTAWAKAAGLPDPNGENWTGGYTGTLVGEHNGWREVSEQAMRAHGWGYVIYGPGVGHHVEAFIGPGDRTAGHGSAPVDFGRIDLFGDGRYRCFIYDPN